MVRAFRSLAVTMLVAQALLTLTVGAAAQGDTTVALAGHPIVGAWLVDPVADDAGNTPSMTTIHADGTLQDQSIDGGGVGAWVPTGWRSADLTIHYRQLDGEGNGIGSTTVRASVIAAEDGGSFQGTYTIEFGAGEVGTPGNGQLGPAVLTGERLTAEPMGIPVAPWPPGAPSAGASIIVDSATGPLGTYLVGPDGRTLYIFEADMAPGSSACVDACADVWPPLVVDDGVSVLAGPGITGSFTTFERPNGSRQVAYDGRPLYLYVGDSGPGDTTGQGVGDVWFVASVEG